MALGFGLAVASGGVALGSISVEAGDVLYLSLEDNQRRLKKRISKILPDGNVPARLHLTTEWPMVGEGCRAYIANWLNQNKDARMVIVDTLKKIRPNRGSRDLYDADYEIGAALQKLSHKHGIAFLIVHHLRKADAIDDPMDMISGSTGLTGSVDGSLVLARSRGEEDAVLHISGRDIEDDAPLSLKFDQATALWEKIGIASPDMTPERQKIMSIMRDTGNPVTARQVAGFIGKEYETVRKRMAAMESAGDIQIDSGNRSTGYYYVPCIPDTNHPNHPNLEESTTGGDSEAGTVGMVGTGYMYTYTLSDGGQGNYRTEAPNLEVARAELVKRYGDRLSNVTESRT